MQPYKAWLIINIDEWIANKIVDCKLNQSSPEDLVWRHLGTI